MTSIETGILGICVLLALFTAGMPIGFAMLLVGSAGFIYLVKLSGAIHILTSIPYGLISNYDFCVLPLFLFMGTIILNAGMGAMLFRLARTLVGRLPGGLSIATIFACGVFAALSGSSIACALTIGLIAVPEMRKYKYSDALTAGSVASGGTLAILIPPSGMFILYGIMCEQSISKLYIAGVIPGILLCLMFIVVAYVWVWVHPDAAPPGQGTSFREKLVVLGQSIDMLALGALVLVGLFVGWFTPTEAGAVGACGALVLSLARRRLSWQGFKDSVIDTINNSGMIFTILVGALIFNAFLAVTTIPMEVAGWVGGLALPPWIVMIIIMVMYVLLGTFLDEMSMILLTLPIFFPVVVKLGYDPIWFGVVVVLVVEMGMISPPVGMTMFVVKGIAPEIPINTIFKGVLPFVIAVALMMVLLLAFPILATFLPSFMSY
jgi:tripartite ATP-independent transporter DctM subunit